MRDIAEGVCARFGVTMDQMRGVNSTRHYARPRQVAMYLCRQMTGQSLPQIGTFFCRDHTTVLHACKTIKSLMEADADMVQTIEGCKEIIRHRGPWRLEALLKVISEPLVTERAA